VFEVGFPSSYRKKEKEGRKGQHGRRHGVVRKTYARKWEEKKRHTQWKSTLDSSDMIEEMSRGCGG
jgi:hypothetical protein